MKYFTYIRANWIFVITHEYNFIMKMWIMLSMLFKKAGRYTNIIWKAYIKNNYKFKILALKRYALVIQKFIYCICFLLWPT